MLTFLTKVFLSRFFLKWLCRDNFCSTFLPFLLINIIFGIPTENRREISSICVLCVHLTQKNIFSFHRSTSGAFSRKTSINQRQYCAFHIPLGCERGRDWKLWLLPYLQFLLWWKFLSTLSKGIPRMLFKSAVSLKTFLNALWHIYHTTEKKSVTQIFLTIMVCINMSHLCIL